MQSKPNRQKFSSISSEEKSTNYFIAKLIWNLAICWIVFKLKTFKNMKKFFVTLSQNIWKYDLKLERTVQFGFRMEILYLRYTWTLSLETVFFIVLGCDISTSTWILATSKLNWDARIVRWKGIFSLESFGIVGNHNQNLNGENEISPKFEEVFCSL